MKKDISITSLIMKYFKAHPNQNISHGPVVDWVTEKWLQNHDEPPRDPWRAIRMLHQEGKLIKVKKGIYKYDPKSVQEVKLWDFSPADKKAILKRDGYRCVVCGEGVKEGVELVVDHIKPKDKGGTNDISNGQTLCMKHNLLKKNYSQTEAGKRYFIKMYEEAVANKDKKMIDFCKTVFDIFDKFDINGHISRPNGENEKE
jgi:5-methylcytosine-specific restriction endonuclease McrA